MVNFFNSIFTRPFGWVLCQIYELVGSYGIALIIFTILAKLILLPFQMKSKKSMIGMQKIQPKLKELEKKYKNDKERYAIAVQKLYKEENVSMMGGCLPLLITFPIMLGLYAIVRQPLSFMLGFGEEQIRQLAEIVGVTIGNSPISNMEIPIAAQMGAHAEQIKAAFGDITIIENFNFLGINLSQTPSFARFDILWIIPILSGASSYFFSWLSKKYQPVQSNEQAAASSGMMNVMMPLMSVWIAFIVPAGLGFYWIINNLLSAVQEPVLQWYYTKYKPSKTGGNK